MILCRREDLQQYAVVYPGLEKVVAFLKENNEPALGRYELSGEDLFLNIDRLKLREAESGKLEAHQRYLDIHIPLDGTELIGWRAMDTISNRGEHYDKESDIEFYDEPSVNMVTVEPGYCLIVDTEDAHLPLVGSGELTKIIVKIRVQ